MKTLISGSVAYDYLMTFPGYFKEFILPDKLESISLSFLVDSLNCQRGGVAPNIAYAMALLGQKPTLWCAVGNDFDDYKSWLENQGVDTSIVRIFQNVRTASFFVNTDLANNKIASFYPGAMVYSSEMSLRELSFKPDLVVISPNDPAAMNLYVKECVNLGYPFVYDPSQQIVRLSKDELLFGIDQALILITNEYESALITKITGLTPDQVVNRKSARERSIVIVTRGADGVDIFTKGKHEHIPAIEATNIVCPTGVGDAFRGGFLTGYVNHLPVTTCARMGSLVASYCLEKTGSQEYSFSMEEFTKRYNELFDENLDFDFQGLSFYSKQ